MEGWDNTRFASQIWGRKNSSENDVPVPAEAERTSGCLFVAFGGRRGAVLAGQHVTAPGSCRLKANVYIFC
jgi:hypothetical protein